MDIFNAIFKRKKKPDYESIFLHDDETGDLYHFLGREIFKETVFPRDGNGELVFGQHGSINIWESESKRIVLKYVSPTDEKAIVLVFYERHDFSDSRNWRGYNFNPFIKEFFAQFMSIGLIPPGNFSKI